MKVSDYIADFMAAKKADVVFGYTGGSIADVIDSVYRQSSLRFVENYHEQASAFAANAYALLTGKTAFCLATSGPGAINLIGGIANAYFDSVPCVFITGNSHSLAKKPSDKIRQNSFQETDIVSVAESLTKYAVYVDSPQNIKYELEKAYHIAGDDRAGPVLLDIPYDVLRKEVNPDVLRGFTPSVKVYDDFNADEVASILSAAKRPVILLGGGCVGSKQQIKDFAEKVKIPVVCSLRALDIIPHNNNCFVGFIGSYGNRYANMALRYCDAMLVLGSRLDERQIGYVQGDFAPNAKIIRVDVDEFELPRKVESVKIHSSVANFLDKMQNVKIASDCASWLELLQKWKKDFTSVNDKETEVSANGFIRFVSENATANTIFCADVGQNQMCTAQAIYLDNGKKLLNSAGLGSMGFSLPAATGAAYADSGSVIVSFNGDGGLQMNIQELQTVKRDNLPVFVIVLNNGCLGMIRKLQENMFDKRYYASVKGFSSPDFCRVAEAYGLPSCKISSVSDYAKVMDFMKKNKNGLIEVELPMIMQANPEPSSKIYEQIPPLSDEENGQIKQELEALL